jgi:hypothetical protein
VFTFFECLECFFVFKKHYLVVGLFKAESYSIGVKGMLLSLAFRLGRPNFWHTLWVISHFHYLQFTIHNGSEVGD